MAGGEKVVKVEVRMVGHKEATVGEWEEGWHANLGGGLISSIHPNCPF